MSDKTWDKIIKPKRSLLEIDFKYFESLKIS